MRTVPAGDRALVLELGTHVDVATHDKVMAYYAHLQDHHLPGVEELVPTYRSLLVYYEPSETDYHQLAEQLRELVVQEKKHTGNTVEVPVKYGGAEGPDLEDVAAYAQLAPDDVIQLHALPLYRVYMVGFAPGFPYLGGLDPRLFVPRLRRPRTVIPAGSVAIGGEQTGIYPIQGPGGWRIIGRTELALFDPERVPPARVQAGDNIRFVPLGGAR